MEPNDDLELHELLQEWQAPSTPPTLEARVLTPRRTQRRSVLSFLLTGHVRVPVPVALSLVSLISLLAWRLATPTAPVPPQIVVRPERIEVPVERVVERIVYRDRAAPVAIEPASGVELLPVTELRARVIRASDRRTDDTN
jgi:hypothetical protein